jgi:hypothetical protein
VDDSVRPAHGLAQQLNVGDVAFQVLDLARNLFTQLREAPAVTETDAPVQGREMLEERAADEPAPADNQDSHRRCLPIAGLRIEKRDVLGLLIRNPKSEI